MRCNEHDYSDEGLSSESFWWDERKYVVGNTGVGELHVLGPNECKRRYHLQKQLRQQTHILKNVLSQHECNSLLRRLDIELTVSGKSWHTARHSAYATTDLPAFEVPIVDAFVRSAVRSRVFPYVGSLIGFNPDDFYFKDLFFVKYEVKEGSQTGLDIHRDGSLFSINILLNPRDEFDGGGTYIKPTDSIIQIEQGDCLIHDGALEHGGAHISRGRRLILVGFVQSIKSEQPAWQRRPEAAKHEEWMHWEVQAEEERAERAAERSTQVDVVEDALVMLMTPIES